MCLNKKNVYYRARDYALWKYVSMNLVLKTKKKKPKKITH